MHALRKSTYTLIKQGQFKTLVGLLKKYFIYKIFIYKYL